MPKGGARAGAGRPPGKLTQAKRDIATMAKTHGREALAVLLEVARDGTAPHAARVSAANALLDRGYGRPSQAVNLGGDQNNPIIHQITRTIIDPIEDDDPMSAPAEAVPRIAKDG